MRGPDFDNRFNNNAAGSKPVDDDRFYYRDDERTITRLVQEPFEVSVFLGLRRFGKTSFLRRVERWCNGTNVGPEGPPNDFRPEQGRFPKSGVKAYFVDMLKPSEIKNRLIFALSKDTDTPATRLVLLDDVQGLSNLYESQHSDRLDIFDALTEVFRKATESRGEKLRVLMSEPTNYFEWLNQTKQIGLTKNRSTDQPKIDQEEHGPAKRAAQAFRRAGGDALLVGSHNLKRLADDEAWALLSGSPPDARGPGAHAFDIGKDVARRINTALGGNPWLLGYAHDLLRAGESENVEKFDQFVAGVRRLAELKDGPKGLKSIYESLTNEERMIVQLLHAAEKGSAEAQSLFKDPTLKRSWREDQAAVHHGALVSLGVAHGTEYGWAESLNLRGLGQYVEASLSSDTANHVYESPDDLDRPVWDSLLKARHPKALLSSRTVIHQFSDLLFQDQQRDDYWARYVTWLSTLPEHKRPHFIVVCGNLVPGMKSDEGSESLRGQLENAFARLIEAEQYLRATTENRRKHFILVPGVLDQKWSTNDMKNASKTGPRAYWQEKMEKYEFSCGRERGSSVLQPAPFPDHRIIFIPVDSTSLDGAREVMGENAARDLCEIRRRISEQFAEDLTAISVNKAGESRFLNEGIAGTYDPDAAAADWERFVTNTSRYVVAFSDAQGGHDDNEILDHPTFRWKEPVRPGAAKKPTKKGKQIAGGFQEWISECGFISTKDLEDTLSEVKKAERSDQPMLRIAVAHHCPQQNRRAALVEFFQADEFRQRLVGDGVKWILHGHTREARRLTQTELRMSVPAGQRAEPMITELVATSGFSAVGDCTPGRKGTTPLSEPTFNEIEITPPSRDAFPSSEFSVEVRLCQWSALHPGAPKVVELK